MPPKEPQKKSNETREPFQPIDVNTLSESSGGSSKSIKWTAMPSNILKGRNRIQPQVEEQVKQAKPVRSSGIISNVIRAPIFRSAGLKAQIDPPRDSARPFASLLFARLAAMHFSAESRSNRGRISPQASHLLVKKTVLPHSNSSSPLESTNQVIPLSPAPASDQSWLNGHIPQGILDLINLLSEKRLPIAGTIIDQHGPIKLSSKDNLPALKNLIQSSLPSSIPDDLKLIDLKQVIFDPWKHVQIPSPAGNALEALTSLSLPASGDDFLRLGNAVCHFPQIQAPRPREVLLIEADPTLVHQQEALISANTEESVKDQLTSQLESIEKIISDSTQEEDLIKPVLSETQKQAVQTLVLSIREAMRKLDEQQTQAPSAILRQNQFSEFKKTCDEAIREARPVLDPLGFKEILANLALAILGLGVFYVVAGLINRERHGNFLFFRPSVVAKQLGLDEIKQEISSMTMPTQGGSH